MIIMPNYCGSWRLACVLTHWRSVNGHREPAAAEAGLVCWWSSEFLSTPSDLQPGQASQAWLI